MHNTVVLELYWVEVDCICKPINGILESLKDVIWDTEPGVVQHEAKKQHNSWRVHSLLWLHIIDIPAVTPSFHVQVL